jgi:hypothetical protein
VRQVWWRRIRTTTRQEPLRSFCSCGLAAVTVDYRVLIMVVSYMSYRTSPDVLLSMNPYMCSLLSPSHNLSSLISNSITKDNTCLDLTFLCCSVQYIFVNRFSNVYSSALNIDLRLVLMITRCIYSLSLNM